MVCSIFNKFKLAVLVYRCLHGLTPSYLAEFPSCGQRQVQAATAVSVDGRTDHPVDAPFHGWRPCVPCGCSTHLELSPITRYVGSVTAYFQAPTQDRFVHQKLSRLCCTCLTSAPSTVTRVDIFLILYAVLAVTIDYATLITSLMMMMA